MPVRDSGVCFACGRNNPHGLRLDIRPADDGVGFEFVCPDRFQGWEGIVHGGIVATLLDELIAWAASERGCESLTGELSVRYRRPMPVGRLVHGFGRIVRERGRLLIGESRLVDETGNPIAEATGKMMKA
ncbi:MAG: PaaI family thioesterase [bacterium]